MILTGPTFWRCACFTYLLFLLFYYYYYYYYYYFIDLTIFDLVSID